MIKRFLPLLVLASVSPVPALAGSITIESVRDADHALLLAKGKVPKGFAVSRSKCSAVQVKDNERYRCTVYYAPDMPEVAQLPTPSQQPPMGYQLGGMPPQMGYQQAPGMQPPMQYQQQPMTQQQMQQMQIQQQMQLQQQMQMRQMQQTPGLTQAQIPGQQPGLR